MGRNASLLAALAVALAVALGAVGSTLAAGTVSHARVAPGGTLRVNLSGADLGSLDPALAYSQWAWQLTYLTNLKLLNYPDVAGSAGTQLVGDAAGLPTVSADGLTYTFAIRPGQRFGSGEAVTARSFADAIDRTLDPRLKSPGAQRSFLGAVVGFDDRVAGKTAHLAGITAVGTTLTVRLGRPDPAILHKLALPFFSAVSKAMAGDRSGVRVPDSAGPYIVKSYDLGRQVDLVRNPFYSGSRPRNPDHLVVTLGTDRVKSLAAVQAGQADYDLGGLPEPQIAALAPLLGKQLFVDRLRFGLDYIALNTAPGRFFADVAARRAVNYAIDRVAMLRARGAYPGTVTDQILPPGMPGYRDDNNYPLAGADPVKARAIFGKGGAMTLYVANTGAVSIQALVVKANLARIGIDVIIRQFPLAEFESRIATLGEPFDAALVAWNVDYPDPSALLNPLFSGKSITATGNVNLSYLDVPKVNALLDAAAATTGAARSQAYADADRVLMTQYAPIVPLLNRNERTFVSSRIDPSCYVFQPVYAAMDLAATCLR